MAQVRTSGRLLCNDGYRPPLSSSVHQRQDDNHLISYRFMAAVRTPASDQKSRQLNKGVAYQGCLLGPRDEYRESYEWELISIIDTGIHRVQLTRYSTGVCDNKVQVYIYQPRVTVIRLPRIDPALQEHIISRAHWIPAGITQCATTLSQQPSGSCFLLFLIMLIGLHFKSVLCCFLNIYTSYR
jgi:hypothetical protein